jgi:hypothetical protein
MKFVEHTEVNNFDNWPMSRFIPKTAQIGVPTDPLRHLPAARWKYSTGATHRGRVLHARAKRPPCLHVPGLLPAWLWSAVMASTSPLLFLPCVRPRPPPCCCRGRHRHATIAERKSVPPTADVLYLRPNQVHHRLCRVMLRPARMSAHAPGHWSAPSPWPTGQALGPPPFHHLRPPST